MSGELDNLFLQAREITDPAARAALLDKACEKAPEVPARANNKPSDL